MKHTRPSCAAVTLSMLVLLVVPAGAVSAVTLFAITNDAELLRIDTSTGTVTEVGSLGISFPTQYVGLDFDVDGTLYVGESRQGFLYRVDVNTGAATFVRAISTAGGLILENMAFAPVPVPGPGGSTFQAGTLFGSENGQLHAIDISTGGTQFIGLTGRDDDSYAMSPDGTLYAVDGHLAFYRIDTRSAARTHIRSNPPCWVSLAFGPDGFLYCTDDTALFPLYRMDPNSGSTTLVANIGRLVIGLGHATADADGDGVDDDADLCPDTAAGEAVDVNGCSDAQVDSDGDGYCAPNAPSSGPSGCVGSDCNDNDPNVHPNAADNQCDALDNDCDGTADDDYSPLATSCGVGECAGNSGLLICVAGGTVDTCDPLDGATPEVCDALDNDCDGVADEGIPPVPTTCGVGECSGNTGEETCVNGAPIDSCDPHQGAVDEVCDALDNDCDGDVDEGFDADGDLIADCFDDCPYDTYNDADGDAVCGDVDVCDDTAIAEGVPTHRLGVNRFALMTADSTEFDTKLPPGGGGGPGLAFTTSDTAGCSCEQIIEALELGNGHVKFGCSISAMEAWVALVNPQ